MFSAAILGLLQALTEFLPVSSSGHLRLAHALLGLEVHDDLLFDIVLHCGTLLAVVIVYRRRLWGLLADALRGLGGMRAGVARALEAHEGLRYAALVVIATLPTGVIGVLLADVLSSELISVPLVGGLLLINGALLWVSRRFDDQGDESARADRHLRVGAIGWREALIIGVAQGCAVLPGISRSGATIVCALGLGVERMRAAEFSFFLSIPAIVGAVILEFDPAVLVGGSQGVTPYLVGAAVSAGGGVMALALLLGVVREAKLHRFSWYCWLLGLAAIAAGLTMPTTP